LWGDAITNVFAIHQSLDRNIIQVTASLRDDFEQVADVKLKDLPASLVTTLTITVSVLMLTVLAVLLVL